MVEADTAVRIVFVVLQAIISVASVCFSASPWTWLHWLPHVVGVGSCRDDHECWTKQLVYRTTVAGFLVFVVLGTLALSGCISHWYQTLPGAITIVLLPLLLIFVPNGLFDTFAQLATVVSAIFLIAQTLLLVDFAQECNDTIFDAGLSARRVRINSDYLRAAKAALIGMSLALLLGAVAGAVILWINFSNGWVVVIALVVSTLLLVVSITEWCKHGNLFASALVTAYSVWLSYEVLVTGPQDEHYSRPDGFKILGLLIAFITLIASIFGSGLGLSGPDSLLGGGAASGDSPNPRAFAVYAGVNAVATLYVATILAPTQSIVGFAFRVIALVGSLFVYGWILLAPMIMPGRF